MKAQFIKTCIVCLATVLWAAASGAAGPANGVSEEEAFDLGTQAYIYGYPLVTMEMTRRVMTNVAVPQAGRAPMFRFANMSQYPTAAFKDVTAPNADTLCSVAWLDLSKEPYVLSLPDVGDRYYLMPMLSGWTDVFSAPGTRATTNKAQTYAITGPSWKGKLPITTQQIKSPTDMVWILGRTYCAGAPADYEAVYKIQDNYSLAPLSADGEPCVPRPELPDPSIDMKTPVRDQVNAMDAEAFFKLLAALMKNNPPAKADAAMVGKMRKIGILAGKDFDISKLDSTVARGLQRAPKAGIEKIMAHAPKAGKLVNGWVVTLKTGDYGADYLQRATVAAIGLGANLPQDAVYPMAEVDSDGNKLTGANKYVLRFPKGQLPPVKGLWSLTMYNADYFFVANPLNRCTLSPRDALQYSPDGSLELYIQHESPGAGKESNWLPAPKGDFILMLRLYWPVEPPRDSILNGTWKPPAVVKM